MIETPAGFCSYITTHLCVIKQKNTSSYNKKMYNEKWNPSIKNKNRIILHVRKVHKYDHTSTVDTFTSQK